LRDRFRNKFDTKSLKVKVWVYFGLFTVILLVILWSLQVLFINNFYQDMKIKETQKIALNIATQFQDADRAQIRSYISDLYKKNEMYIQIESVEGVAVFIPYIDYDAKEKEDAKSDIEELPSDSPALTYYPNIYQSEIGNLREELTSGKTESISKRTIEPKTGQETLEYAGYLVLGKNLKPELVLSSSSAEESDNRVIMYIFSPLYPMESTVDILSNQLIYVTIISLLLALLLSFYLANMVSKPITKITKQANQLADGNYGVVFAGEHYSEIIKLADTLTYASMELSRASEMQKDLIANVSHDLRTPLTMIRSYAEMIQDLSGDDPEKRTAHLGIIIDESERLSSLVSELLEISKLQSGEQLVKYSDVSIKNLIASIIQSYQGLVEQGGYNLIFISKGEGMVRADEARIKQVVNNLISNALKYGGKDKTVEIRMFEEDDYVRVEVTDHGMGIPKKDIKHIWDRYYKSSAHYRRTDSTGLGLSIIKEILLLHGAVFGVESTLRKGSTFWFELKADGPTIEEETIDG
jgi:signal transduction histidine kinase